MTVKDCSATLLVLSIVLDTVVRMLAAFNIPQLIKITQQSYTGKEGNQRQPNDLNQYNIET